MNNITNVIIGSNVRQIGVCAFYNKNIENVTISNGVTTISSCAFLKNQLTSVVIPNSVTIIDAFAFSKNQLTSVSIGNSTSITGRVPFYKNAADLSNPNLASITINRSCSSIKADHYYPYTEGDNYGSQGHIGTHSGVTIYGSNNEVCDAW